MIRSQVLAQINTYYLQRPRSWRSLSAIGWPDDPSAKSLLVFGVGSWLRTPQVDVKIEVDCHGFGLAFAMCMLVVVPCRILFRVGPGMVVVPRVDSGRMGKW